MANLAISLATGFAANFLISLFAPSQKVEGPRLNDLNAPKSSYGAAIPRVYGSVRLSGNLIWAKNIREVTRTTSSGGKGGGGASSTTYSYFGSFASLLCSGPIVGIKRLWLNSKLVYNIAEDADDATLSKSQEFANTYARFYPGDLTQGQDSLIAADKGINNTPAYRGRAYLVLEELPLEEYGNQFPAVSCEVVQSGYYSGGRLYSTDITASAIIQDVCSRVGLTPGDIDTTELNDVLVRGFWTNQSGSARDAIAQLQRAFFFDAVESGGKLKFIKQVRPGLPIAVPFGDLSTYEFGSDRPDEFKESRTQDAELPDEVTVTYSDPDFSYQQNSQTDRRQVSPNKNKLDIRLDIVLTSSQALAIARRSLYLEWIRRRKFEFNLPLKYVLVEPGDVVGVPFYDSPQRIYLSKVNVGANFLLECEGTVYDPSILLLQAIAEPPTVDLSIPVASNTELAVLDLPLLKDTDTDFGVYAAGNGNSAWRRADVFISRNGGASYDFAKTLLTRTPSGVTFNRLGTSIHGVRDLRNSLTVDVSGQLESVGEVDFLNGKNIALVGDEIIYYKNAQLVGDGIYRLSEFLRGMRGTEWAIASHSTNDPFYAVGSYIERIEGTALDINALRLYKAPIPGQAIADLDPLAFTSTGRSLKPWSPVLIKGTRSGFDLTISWVRRVRKNGMMLDFSDVPLVEATEAYEIEIMNGSTVARTLSSSTPSVVYTQSQQIADFGSPQSAVSVRIYQMSASVGRGYVGIAIV